MDNYFVKLNSINVNEKTEKKNGMTYLSWVWAWAEVKKMFPDAVYTIYENKDGWNYHTDGRTAWVKTGVTVNSIEHIEYLPVMDTRNRSIPLDRITSFDVNTAIQRSLTKACARHGLGLYVYAGEDLPETDFDPPEQITPPGSPEYKSEPPKTAKKYECLRCGNVLKPIKRADGSQIGVMQWDGFTNKHYGQSLCLSCMNKIYPDWTEAHGAELS